MKIFKRDFSEKYTPVWGITITRWAIVIALGSRDVVIELPRRKKGK